ncbi:MAG: ribose-phosphate diphosphokinase [Pseudomonadota bacterium]
MNLVKIFSGNSNRKLAKDICMSLNVKLGDALVTRFKDGEVRVQIHENVRKCEVFIIQSTNPPAEHWDELHFLIDAARRASASEITAVVPYFGYSRQERKDAPRVPISLKVKMEHLVASGAQRILTMDLHAGASQGFVDIPVDHLYGPPILIDEMSHIIKKKGGQERAVFASDLGFSKVASHYARIIGCDFVPCRKSREVNVVREAEVIGDVSGKTVFYMDDMIDTGGTVTNFCREMKNAGAEDIHVAVTHAVLGKGWDDMERGLLGAPVNSLIFTDTILPSPEKLKKIKEKFDVVIASTAPIFATAIREISIGGSVGTLFNQWESKMENMGRNG